MLPVRVVSRGGQQGVLILPFRESWRSFTQPALFNGSVFSFTLTLDEMGTRIDDLEKNVVELMLQAGMKEQEISKQ